MHFRPGGVVVVRLLSVVKGRRGGGRRSKIRAEEKVKGRERS